jgi:serine/threonine-protein kinase HipA
MSSSERVAEVFVQNKPAAIFKQNTQGYTLTYLPDYKGLPISLTLPVRLDPYVFTSFPAFFDGLLPEGPLLEGLLKEGKIDRQDYFTQLLHVGKDLVGAVTVKETT